MERILTMNIFTLFRIKKLKMEHVSLETWDYYNSLTVKALIALWIT